MRKILLSMLTLVLTVSLSAQSTYSSTHPSKDFYLHKSKSQKTAAFILLGCGVTMVLIASPGKSSFSTTAVLGVGGIVLGVASVPLFLSSGSNKRKARRMSAFLEMQQLPAFARTGPAIQSYPALSLKIHL